ncbi:MAG: hypothetical protein B6243_12070 [Anaerolineaceae bacterium 4572_5.2]|nr:MAG: hypothetical protein B6243_12070 [Anaerolineaceae bacterium 4572_5.2]
MSQKGRITRLFCLATKTVNRLSIRGYVLELERSYPFKESSMTNSTLERELWQTAVNLRGTVAPAATKSRVNNSTSSAPA